MIACATCGATGFLATGANESAFVTEIECHVCHGAGACEPEPMPEHCRIHQAGSLCGVCSHLVTTWAVCPFTGEPQGRAREDEVNAILLEAIWPR